MSILARVAVAFIAGAILLAAGPAHARVDERDMSVGEEVTFQGVREFAVENQQVLSSQISKDGRTLVVRAQKSGVSKLLLRAEGTGDGSRTIDIMVGLRPPAIILKELDNLLRNYPHIQVRTNRTQVVVEGGVKSESELAAIKEIERRYEGQISNLVTVGPSGLRRNVMVRLDLHYVQVRRRLSRNLGVHYPTNISGGSIFNIVLNSMNGASLTTQAGLISDLLPSLDINESSGYIKVMRTDTLITENGSKAVYKNGSELQVKLVGTLGAGTLQPLFFGSELTVTPRLSSSNDAVSLDIIANISVRDSAAQQDGVPGRTLDSVSTSVHIPMGQSVMLAGLDLRTVGRTTTGLPWLNRIPILGYLFGSESKDAESAYGVIYITPTLIQEGTEQLQPLIDRALKYFEKPGSLPR